MKGRHGERPKLDLRRLGGARLARVAAAVGVGAALLGVGLLGVAPSQGKPRPELGGVDGAPTLFSPRRGAIPVVATTPAGVLRALDRTLPLVDNVDVVDRTIPNEDGTAGPTVLSLEFDLLVDSFEGPDLTRAIWEGNLLAGAVADHYAALGLGAIGQVLGTFVTPDGRRQVYGGGLGDVVRDQLFDEPPAAAVVRERATVLGLRDVTLSIGRVVQATIVVEGRADDPQQTALRLAGQPGGVAELLGAAPTSFEGVVIDVRDRNGAPVLRLGTAARAGASTVWTRPDLDIPRRELAKIPERP